MAGLFLVTSAQSHETTSIEFSNGGTLTSGEIAGDDPVADWNVGTLSGTPGSNSGNQVTNSNSAALVNADGSASALSYSIVSYGDKSASESFSSSSDSNAADDSILMSNGAATRGVGSSGASAPNPVVLTLSGLNAGDNYNFYVYVGTQGLLLGEYSVGLQNGPTYYAATSYGGFDSGDLTSFANSSSSSDFEAAANGGPISATGADAFQSNYVELSGYTGSSTAVITLTELGDYPGSTTFSQAGSGGGNTGDTVTISGVQVVDLGAAVVPEPTTVWSVALGLLVLVGFQMTYRNRLARR